VFKSAAALEPFLISLILGFMSLIRKLKLKTYATRTLMILNNFLAWLFLIKKVIFTSKNWNLA
jgi:hypothetical protein